jgi:MGT family glycosyltransferase
VAHIAFFTPPSAGHLNPTLGLAAELVRRGHEVTYATTDEFAPRVAEVSTRVVRYEEQVGADFRSFTFTGRSLVDAMLSSLEETAARYPELLDKFGAHRPDVVVYDNGAWWGRLLAAHWQVPAVQVCPMLVANEHWSMSERYTKLNALSPRLWWFFLKLSKVLRQIGTDVSPKDLVTGDGAPRRVVFIPREFQYHGDTFDETFHFVGPCLHERKFLGSWERPHDDGPLVLVTLGTIYNRHPDFFRTCMQACAGLGGHVVIALGDGIDPADLGPAPPNVEVRSFVAQTDVLRQADLFITHAGMGSTMEALYHGVPMLAAPQMAEEQANADRIVELGLGRQVVSAGLTVEQLRAEIVAMLADTAVRRRAHELRDVTRGSGGAAAAADCIEAALNVEVSR